MRRQPATVAALLLGLLLECTEAKKHCWYFEGLYPTYYICRSYEDCCGSRCCVRALSIQRLWYFWFLLMMGVLFCCGAGFFIRRRMYPPPLIEEPAFNVSYTRQPPNPGPEAQQLCGWARPLRAASPAMLASPCLAGFALPGCLHLAGALSCSQGSSLRPQLPFSLNHSPSSVVTNFFT
ncbi:vesicular, overexpressed in cancer, prosurvival protein 1 isoform X1 [Sapajus apella]|uniref:WW domain binding protein VOPP1 n=1 Tax=Sapajus apella TaxID=9515 RepID=A0A6J3F3H1_SAPAP|nr:vesicular, overexpressed in cancer, prosurvival protein 1 isoform X1 [Sapajus apella]